MVHKNTYVEYLIDLTMIKKNLNLWLFIFGIIIVGTMLLVSQHKLSFAQQTAFKTSDLKTANFEIKYPSDWTVRGEQKVTDKPLRLYLLGSI
jgi:hypothetical protein